MMLIELTTPTGELLLLDPTTIRLVEPWRPISDRDKALDDARPRTQISLNDGRDPIYVAETTREIRDRLADMANHQRGGHPDPTPIGPTVETGGLGFGAGA